MNRKPASKALNNKKASAAQSDNGFLRGDVNEAGSQSSGVLISNLPARRNR
jgi:hypothetical protein